MTFQDISLIVIVIIIIFLLTAAQLGQRVAVLDYVEPSLKGTYQPHVVFIYLLVGSVYFKNN